MKNKLFRAAASALLTLLLAVEALRWGFLASFGRWRMPPGRR